MGAAPARRSGSGLRPTLNGSVSVSVRYMLEELGRGGGGTEPAMCSVPHDGIYCRLLPRPLVHRGRRPLQRPPRSRPAGSGGRAGGNRYRWGWHVTGPVGWGCTDIFRGPNPRDFAGFVALGGGSGEQRGRRAGRVHRAAGVAGLLHVHGSAASGGQFNTEMAKKECPRLPDPASGHGGNFKQPIGQTFLAFSVDISFGLSIDYFIHTVFTTSNTLRFKNPKARPEDTIS